MKQVKRNMFQDGSNPEIESLTNEIHEERKQQLKEFLDRFEFDGTVDEDAIIDLTKLDSKETQRILDKSKPPGILKRDKNKTRRLRKLLSFTVKQARKQPILSDDSDSSYVDDPNASDDDDYSANNLAENQVNGQAVPIDDCISNVLVNVCSQIKNLDIKFEKTKNSPIFVRNSKGTKNEFPANNALGFSTQLADGESSAKTFQVSGNCDDILNTPKKISKLSSKDNCHNLELPAQSCHDSVEEDSQEITYSTPRKIPKLSLRESDGTLNENYVAVCPLSSLSSLNFFTPERKLLVSNSRVETSDSHHQNSELGQTPLRENCIKAIGADLSEINQQYCFDEHEEKLCKRRNKHLKEEVLVPLKKDRMAQLLQRAKSSDLESMPICVSVVEKHPSIDKENISSPLSKVQAKNQEFLRQLRNSGCDSLNPKTQLHLPLSKTTLGEEKIHKSQVKTPKASNINEASLRSCNSEKVSKGKCHQRFNQKKLFEENDTPPNENRSNSLIKPNIMFTMNSADQAKMSPHYQPIVKLDDCEKTKCAKELFPSSKKDDNVSKSTNDIQMEVDEFSIASPLQTLKRSHTQKVDSPEQFGIIVSSPGRLLPRKETAPKDEKDNFLSSKSPFTKSLRRVSSTPMMTERGVGKLSNERQIEGVCLTPTRTLKRAYSKNAASPSSEVSVCPLATTPCQTKK